MVNTLKYKSIYLMATDTPSKHLVTSCPGYPNVIMGCAGVGSHHLAECALIGQLCPPAPPVYGTCWCWTCPGMPTSGIDIYYCSSGIQGFHHVDYGVDDSWHTTIYNNCFMPPCPNMWLDTVWYNVP